MNCHPLIFRPGRWRPQGAKVPDFTDQVLGLFPPNPPPLTIVHVKIGNTIVIAVLRSPLHRVLSGSTAVIRYHGRKSGREISTPVQYVRKGDDVLILVGRPDGKSWWRNFQTERDIDVLVQGTWRMMKARAVQGAAEPDTVSGLLDAYVSRFPRATRSLGDGTRQDQVGRAVVVNAQPR